MKMPTEFVLLVRWMHQDIDIDYSDGDELATAMIAGFTLEQRTVVRQFLDDLLAQELSAAELNEIWNVTKPDWGFTGDGVRGFLRKVRDAPDQPE